MLSKLWLSFKLALIIIKKTTATKYSNSRVSRWNFTIDSIYLNIIKDIFIKYLVGLALEYKWYFSNTNQENNSKKNFKFTCYTILYPKWAFTIGSMGPFFNYFDQNCAHYWSNTTPGWHWWRNSFTVIRENLHTVDISNTPTSRRVNIVKERPPTHYQGQFS